MAVSDPYAPCPCGSGQKYKWCCQKVEAHSDRAQRLFEGGQTELALAALDEGLRKEPGNPLLLIRRAFGLIQSGQPAEALEAVREALRKHPAHLGGLVLLTRLVLESEGRSAGVAQLQQALTAYPKEKRRDLAGLVRVVGVYLAEVSAYPAAVRHLKLAQALQGPEADPTLPTLLKSIESGSSVSPWLKNPEALAPAPQGLPDAVRARFDEALGWAEEGLWSSAAAAFSALSAEPAAAPLAHRNEGLCRLWLADDSAAATALRRYVATLGPTTEAVDLEALCQEVAPPGSADLVERVRLSWPVRNAEALRGLQADPAAFDEGDVALDEDDPDSVEAHSFALLDRPQLASPPEAITARDVPRVLGRVLLGADTVWLEAHDDGRLDPLADRFTALAGPSIPPAHPKTKVLDRDPRVQVALTWEWVLPEGIDRATARRLNAEQGTRILREAWPDTPMAALHGRTPRQAARAGDSVVPLRAAACLIEYGNEGWHTGFDFDAFRDELGIEREPVPDPATVDVNALHLARLPRVEAAALPDEPLAALYKRARAFLIPDAIRNAAAALADRPEAFGRVKVEPLGVFSDLATLDGSRAGLEPALEWVRRGRQTDPPDRRALHAPVWDMLEVRVRAQAEDPEAWVPELAAVLDRYADDPVASRSVLANLMDMGLVEVSPNPDRPGDVLLDSRALQAVLARYGPRVTTASGRLGVSATKPEIWTPGSTPGGGKPGLWTPGSGAPAGGTTSSPPGASGGGGGSKLILPGR